MSVSDLKIGALYVVRNTMGGIFNARLVEVTATEACAFKVEAQGNPDWHGWAFMCGADRVVRVATDAAA